MNLITIHSLRWKEQSPISFIHNTEEQDFSSRNISGLLYVSEASLSRFAQKCGFHGYREFIYEYKQSLAPGPEENIPNFEVSEFNTYQELLNKANALLDKAQIAHITRLLVSKPRVYVYGRGSSGLVAQEMKLRFMRIGLNIEAITDSHIMKVNSVILDEAVWSSESASADRQKISFPP